MNKNILAFILALSLPVILFAVFTPHFTVNFTELRAQEQAAQAHQVYLREKAAQEKRKEVAQKRAYLMGHFDPSARDDFALVPTKYTLGERGIYLRRETFNAFLKMRAMAELANIDLLIASATRNFDYQKGLWERKWTGYTMVAGEDLSESISDGTERFRKILEYSAAPGTSRHHWGTEIDINDANPEYFDSAKGAAEYDWLVANARRFGFCQVYDAKGRGGRYSGYEEEKWHWSYLPLARDFTQEYKSLIRDEDISGFEGDEYTSGQSIIENYVLGINPECI